MSRVWVTGHNSPGCLPDSEPVEHESFREGVVWLHEQITDVMLGVDDDDEFVSATVVARYTEVNDYLMEAPVDDPLSFYFEGQVYWLADFDLHPEGEVE